MTNTIEVPISLIKAGDMDAIRELLPKPSLFGRWATHPDYGRVLTIDDKQDRAGKVCVARLSGGDPGGAERRLVPFDSLTLDPVELTTAEDYENAPEGTIVAYADGTPFLKQEQGVWRNIISGKCSDEELAEIPRKVLRWGWGEQP